MTLRRVIEEAIADAFGAGAQWHAVRTGQDSGKAGREARRWQSELRYKEALKQHQQAAARSVAQGIMRAALGPDNRQADFKE